MKYNIIYSDPPWAYRNTRKVKLGGSTAGRGVVNHYDVMSLKEIKELPVQDISHENCFLFLWATFPNLPEALEVINAWGFTYKTVGFNWWKMNTKSNTPFVGTGSYSRSNGEICLLATKGKPKVLSHSVSQVIIAKREQHSKKPDIIRDKIVELCGDIPRVELFARTCYDGWDTIGNGVDGLDIRESIELLKGK